MELHELYHKQQRQLQEEAMIPTGEGTGGKGLENNSDTTKDVHGGDDDVYEEPLCTSETKTFTSRINLHGGELGMFVFSVL